MNINERIKQKREERGLSRKTLADGLGVSESTTYRIEMNPNINPNNKLVNRIYDILQINVSIKVDDVLIYDSQTKQYDIDSFTPTNKSIIFNTFAKEEKYKRIDNKKYSYMIK